MTAMVGVSAAIDGAWEADQKGHRPHLGASQIGKPCDRMLVYAFRHAVTKRHGGRMLRLWNRGHREESALVASLRRIGMEVREYAERLCWRDGSGSYVAIPWEEPLPPDVEDVSQLPWCVEAAEKYGVRLRQWSFSDLGGHHAGSCDGFAVNPSDNPLQFPGISADTWFGLEFKTYNTKGHLALCANAAGVRAQKPEHYAQMQAYMHRIRLPWQPDTPVPFYLYLGVNKNDDSLYDELVLRDEAAGHRALERAAAAVGARQLPPRLHASATHFDCKYCDYSGPCHHGAELPRGCRTCRSAAAETEGTDRHWHCALWNARIPGDVLPAGCDSWAPLTD